MDSPERALRALQGRMHRHRAAGEHQQVADVAREGLAAARAGGYDDDALGFTRHLAQALHALDDYPAMLTAATDLTEAARDLGDAGQEATGRILRSTALRSLGETAAAAHEAETAVHLLTGSPDHTALLQAHQVLIAALVENGRIDHAWDLRPAVTGLLTEDLDRVEAGKAHWTLGNLAFMTGQFQTGTEHHHQAAHLLAAAHDVLLWARFNKACADIRLQAEIADADTADHIHKAELAYGLIGASDTDRAALALARARWERANGNIARAERILDEAIEPYRGDGFPPFLIPVYRLWGKLLRELGHTAPGKETREPPAA